MSNLRRRAKAVPVPVLLVAALTLAACGGGGTPSSAGSATAATRPQYSLAAPKSMLAATVPQPNGTMWVLAGTLASRGLFELDAATGKVVGSISVSNAAQSVAQSPTGVIGLALGTPTAGSLELLDGNTGKVVRTVALPAPARQVAAGNDGTTFYVLTGSPSVASVSIVDSASGQVRGTVPVPANAASVVPDLTQGTLYVLQRDGHVSEIAIVGGKVTSRFVVGESGTSLALSPDGTTLYALKDLAGAANVAVVDVATQSVRRVLPAPVHCVEVIVSAGGSQLYDVVGTADYGNIQVFAI